MRSRFGAFLIFLIGHLLNIGPIRADWTAPVNIGPPVSSASDEWYPSISTFANFIVLKTARGPNAGLFVSTKNNEVWGPLDYIAAVGNPANLAPAISQDGREVYFSTCCGGYGDYDIWKTAYDTVTHSWQTPVNLGPNVNDEWGQSEPFLSYDGQDLYFLESSLRFDGIVVSHRVGDEWNYPELVMDYVFSHAENVSLTMDENEIYMNTYTDSGWRVYYSRKDSSGNWTPPEGFAPINDYGIAVYPRVNADGSRVYFHAWFPGTHGGADIWYVEKIPVGIKEEEKSNYINFNIYPNPTNMNFKIEIPSGFRGKVVIYDVLGKKIDERDTERSFIWPGSGEPNHSLSSGVYYFKLINDGGATVASKKATLLK